MWINNCVGVYTQKLFLLFTFYGAITFTYSMILCKNQFYQELKHVDDIDSIASLNSCMMGTLSLLTAGLIFVLIVMFDQIVIITNRLSVLERVRLYANRLGKRVRKRAK